SHYLSGPSLTGFSTGPLRIDPRRCARRNHDRCVVAFGAAAGIWLPKDPGAEFVAEPLAHRFRAESPYTRPTCDRIMPFLECLVRRSRRFVPSLVKHHLLPVPATAEAG